MTNLKEEIRSALKGAGMSKVNDDILTKCTLQFWGVQMCIACPLFDLMELIPFLLVCLAYTYLYFI